MEGPWTDAPVVCAVSSRAYNIKTSDQKSECWARKDGGCYEQLRPFTNTVSLRWCTRSLVDLDIGRQRHRVCPMDSSELVFQAYSWTEGSNSFLCNTKETDFIWERVEIISFSTRIVSEMNKFSILMQIRYRDCYKQLQEFPEKD